MKDFQNKPRKKFIRSNIKSYNEQKFNIKILRNMYQYDIDFKSYRLDKLLDQTESEYHRTKQHSHKQNKNITLVDIVS